MFAKGLIAIGIASLLASSLPAAGYEVVTVTNGGTIDGSVALSGTPPARAEFKVTKNQDYCGPSIPDQTYVVGSEGALANVVVYLENISQGKAPSAEPLALVNEHCMFVPHAQGAMVGEQVKFSNSDMLLHNTHPQDAETTATIFNIALPFRGFAVTKRLPGSPGLIKVKCDAHEWMQAWILALNNPYFATTDSDGHFSIKDVPPGTYTLVAWHEAAGQKSTPVAVAAGQTVNSKITFPAR